MTFDLNKALNGDSEAWSAFVARYAPVIFAAASRTLGSAGGGGSGSGARYIAVDDIVQEVFLRLVKDDARTLRRFDPEKARLTTWLTIITRHITIDHLRRKGVNATSLDAAKEVAHNPEGADPDGTGGIDSLPLHVLTSRQRLVLTLLFEDERTVEEAAQFLGVSEQTVRSTKHKALMRLREAMAPEDPKKGDFHGDAPNGPDVEQEEQA